MSAAISALCGRRSVFRFVISVSTPDLFIPLYNNQCLNIRLFSKWLHCAKHAGDEVQIVSSFPVGGDLRM